MGFLALFKPGKSALSIGGNGKSRTRARVQMFLAVLVVLNAVLLFLVFRPPGLSLAERQAESQRSRASYDSTLATVKQMRELRAKLGSAIQNDEKFSTEHFLSRRTAFSAMLSDLERLASETQLKTTTIAYQLKEDAKRPGFENVAVNMTVEGGYPELMRFVNKLEGSDLFWIVHTMTVSSSQARALRLTLQMETYAVL